MSDTIPQTPEAVAMQLLQMIIFHTNPKVSEEYLIATYTKCIATVKNERVPPTISPR
jgi:hypothetical protein